MPMPNRRRHLELDLLFIAKYNMGLTIDDVVLIEALIDEPARYANIIINLIESKINNCNSKNLYNLIESYKSGLKINGVFSHDWGLNRARRGKSTRILKKIVSCIFGDDARLIVDLHSSIDMVYAGRFRCMHDYRKWATAHGIDPRVIEFVEAKLEPGVVHGEGACYKG